MSGAPKHIRPPANAGGDRLAIRERGQRRLRRVTTLTVTGAIAVAGITTALASQVPAHHAAARTGSTGVPSSAAAIAAAQQAASNQSAANAGRNSYSGSVAGGSTYVPSSSQSAPVASSGGS